ncbi:MAG: ATP-binding protein, partial [Verrucomicrobiaceae bacterium]
LVQPLRHLAAKLPEIEKPGSLELAEITRQDEIGDVARAFMRTREALQNEREQREQAEKLAVLGRMAAALAHEIQNPVAAIKMHAQLAGADIIENEAARIEALVSQWMFLSKPEPPAMSELDAAQLLHASLASHRAQMDHAHVRAETVMEDGLLIRGDRRRLIQVFSNLIINAVQAMPLGGLLTVSAKSISSEHGTEISFVDSGSGFSERALQHFAEFFYSEKEGGMGIGLSVASEIVKAHGGELSVTNRGKGGACVTVMLPATLGSGSS